MAQIARNLTDTVDVFFNSKRYLIHDRDPLYTQEFLSILSGCGIEAIKIAATVTQPECVRGALCSNDQRRLSESDDFLW